LYSDELSDVFSGGIVYMYHQEENDYGLVKYQNGQPQPMENYKRLVKAMQNVDPTTMQMDAYNPSNVPQECPNVVPTWQVSGSNLPPTPDAALCNCMASAATCRPKSSLAEKDYGAIFDFICDEDEAACAGIKADTASGIYGPYVMCNPREQLAHVMSTYHANEGGDYACDFEGDAELVSIQNTASLRNPNVGFFMAQISSANPSVAIGLQPSGRQLLRGCSGGRQ
jgi:1,3-beta-glucanosyltransferase GAS1